MPVVSKRRSFRRFIKLVFASFCKLRGCQNRFQEEVLRKLQDIEDTIEIMAREMARQAEHK